MGKDKDAFRTIGEVSESLALPQHVIRFWEVRFPQLSPLKRGGNRRYYRPDDVALIAAIKRLLYEDGYTIKGVQRLLKSKGTRGLAVEIDDGRAVSPDADGAPSGAPPTDEPQVPPQPRQPVSPDVRSKVSVSQADHIASLAAEIVSCAQRLVSARKAAL